MAYVTAGPELSLPGIRTARKGFFARALDRMVEARMREAQRVVNGYLLTLDDQTLAELGHDRAALRRLGTPARAPL